ncbi:5-hydroxytryptamine receptor 3A-like [Plectropomus leopardus]|uniref:5-hydroxytryptamine receptor 3A-like n=1 Tax=Plectropomus leopardus TaxID=160734 RepID=UPI001C4C3652|nr:5-hydroxytryptamine receptor 3A-like [Plectropomus leopardus]
MTLTCLLFLLLLTGELDQFCMAHTGVSASNYSEQPERPDNQQKSSYSFEESGSASNYSEKTELQQNFSRSSEEVDRRSSRRSCRDRDILKHLNLTKNEEISMTRPGGIEPTRVTLAVALYAILDVNEKDQEFVSYLWVDTIWKDDLIHWEPEDFCDIKEIYIPTEVLWKPDIIIQEMTEKDKAPSCPYLIAYHHSEVIFRNSKVVVSTCRMQVYQFPFDVLSCNLTFKSVIHSDRAIQLENWFNTSVATNWSHGLIQTQSEWLFLNMTVKNQTVNNFCFVQSTIIYTITMKRRSVLYIANFLLPILFFLCLDLASFMISDTGGEKLSFKVTVLLAVTVMQLILNEILPCSSDRIPLIAIYCIGIFGLMMLSLMETIVVMYLMEKDSASQDSEADKDHSWSEDCGVKQSKVSFHNSFREVEKFYCDVCLGETPSKEGSSSQLPEGCRDSGKLSDEPNEAMKTLTLVLNSRREDRRPGYWTRMARKINKVFFIFYVIATIVFLLFMFVMWSTAEDDSA